MVISRISKKNRHFPDRIAVITFSHYFFIRRKCPKLTPQKTLSYIFYIDYVPISYSQTFDIKLKIGTFNAYLTNGGRLLRCSQEILQ